ncbi:MAG: pyridoxamine 5'-phosphate oxidase [Myxococcota bacterium]
MASWLEFATANPAMAAAGRALLYQFGVPLGYLATVRRDGGPRVHPFCPILCESGVFGLIGSSPKQRDLARDGRYAVHSFPAPDRDDEFYFTGRATLRSDPRLVDAVRAAVTATGATSDGHETLFELEIERALLSRYKMRGGPNNWPPLYEKWAAPAASSSRASAAR